MPRSKTPRFNLFSAYLARFVNDEDNLLLHLAVEQLERSDSILMGAWQDFKETANQVSASESGVCHSSLEQFSIKLGSISQISHEGLKASIYS